MSKSDLLSKYPTTDGQNLGVVKNGWRNKRQIDLYQNLRLAKPVYHRRRIIDGDAGLWLCFFSAGAVKGAQSLLVKQLIWFGISIAAFLYAMFMDLNWLRNRSWLVYSFCILALVMVLVPGLGVKVNGAQRWLGLGPLRVQPSEFAKLGIVLMLASYFASNQRDKATLLKGFLLPSVIIGMFCVLIILQPDFGTCFLCGAVAATMMFHSGTSLRWLLPVSSLLIGVFSVLVYFDPVRIRRVTSFLDVEANANDSGYQLWQGMLAFGVGGVDGVGLGLGRQQVHFLPEAHTDFIFPVIGEELGLICTFIILLLFFLFYSFALIGGFESLLVYLSINWLSVRSCSFLFRRSLIWAWLLAYCPPRACLYLSLAMVVLISWLPLYFWAGS